MALPSFTKIYRQDTYPAIDPTRPELSAKDKTVIVTGAGIGGIGSEAALSFAKAGAPKIALVGRTEKTLQETKNAIANACPETNVFIAIADVSQGESIGRAAHDIRVALGAWDIFANFAAILPPVSTIAGADEDEWWRAFEITAKFPLYFAKHFIPKARPNATFININAGASHIPATRMPKVSAYSKSSNQRVSSFRNGHACCRGGKLMI
jgi:NAD(P)-dependent dehydrogenase (short-subunit alcohol dehydrogenase family)